MSEPTNYADLAEGYNSSDKGNRYNFNLPESLANKIIPYKNTEHVFRILGAPYKNRKVPTDMRLYTYVVVAGDDGVFFPHVVTEGLKKIINNIRNKCLKNTWVKAQKQRLYEHFEAHPEVVTRLLSNNSSNAMDKGWDFVSMVLLNVVDVINKKIGVPVKGFNEEFNTGIPGLTLGAFKAFQENVWSPYHFDYTQKNVYYQNLGNNDPYHKWLHPNESVKIKNAVMREAVESPKPDISQLDPSALVNLDELLPEQPTKDFFVATANFIKQIDKEFNTDFVNQFVEVISDEGDTLQDSELPAGFWATINAPSKGAYTASKPTGDADAMFGGGTPTPKVESKFSEDDINGLDAPKEDTTALTPAPEVGTADAPAKDGFFD